MRRKKSEANRLAVNWANRAKGGDKTLVSFHDSWYIIEKFDDLESKYQIVDKISKDKYDYYKGIINDASNDSGRYKVLQGLDSQHRNTNRGTNANEGTRRSLNADVLEYTQKNSRLQRVDAETSKRNDDRSEKRASSFGSNKNRQWNDTIGLNTKPEAEVNTPAFSTPDKRSSTDEDRRYSLNGIDPMDMTDKQIAEEFITLAEQKDGKRELKELISNFREAVNNGKITSKNFDSKAEKIINHLVTHFDNRRDYEAQKTLNDIRNMHIRIKLSDVQRKEAENIYGSLKDFRVRFMGYITMANDGVLLDIQYHFARRMKN